MSDVYVVYELSDPYQLPIGVFDSLRSLSKALGLHPTSAQKARKASPYRRYFELLGKYGVDVTKIPK